MGLPPLCEINDEGDPIINIIEGNIAKFCFDWVTEVMIEREIPQPDGTFKKETQVGSYSYLEDLKVIEANFKGNAPHNRKSYPMARCALR